MDLSQAIAYHSTVTLEGWNQAARMWEPGISQGDFRRQDQFIVNRSFGLVKRLFNCPAGARIPSRFCSVRTEEEDIYIVESENPNLRHDRVYSYSYQLRKAPYWAYVYNLTTQTLASGVPGRVEDRELFRCPADVERYGSLGSDEVEGLRYSQISVILPGNVKVTRDHFIRIGDTRFEIQETYLQVKERVAICSALNEDTP